MEELATDTLPSTGKAILLGLRNFFKFTISWECEMK